MMDLFSELFDMFDGMDVFGSRPASRNDSRTCPCCGRSWTEVRQTGKFGCGECYKTFRPAAEELIRQYQAAQVHTGKIPSRSSADIKVKRRIETLQKELKDAVNKEDYERAAKLHAELKKLEGGAAK